ncbi:MAG: IS66 family transposase [Muribaculaceae bacterium]|nr:IS66 family transposase [Muribaculaceae bacterium]
MTALEQTLTATVETLTKTNEMLMVQIEALSEQLKKQTAQIAWLNRQLFGRKSERFIPGSGQPGLFSEEDFGEKKPEAEEVPKPTEPEVEVKGHRRKHTSRKRESWENLPVLVIDTIEPKDIDLSRYRKIGEEVSHTVEFQPGMMYRRAIVRPKFGLKDPTEPVERGKGVIIAPMPLLPVAKGMAGPTLLAEVVLQKYEYHMPFYRQIKQFAHLGMEGIKEATMTGWFRRTMELLRPLYEALKAEVMASDYIQADETTVPVINNERHQADKEYLWMARSVMEGLAVFFYDKGSRAAKVIKNLTDRYGFKGYLQCDGYSAYTAAYGPCADVRLVHCMVHICREWDKAMSQDPKAVSWVKARIRELYHIEHECDTRGMNFEQRKEHRQLKAKPVMDEIKEWIETKGIRYSPESLIGKAVTYTYNRWPNMMRYLEDGRIRLDNNLAENEIRPITLGRKNYLFCGNHKAAEDMCVVQSLLATCRNHDVNPRAYLNNVIANMPYYEKASPLELASLLPHRWIMDHPEAKMNKVRQMAK